MGKVVDLQAWREEHFSEPDIIYMPQDEVDAMEMALSEGKLVFDATSGNFQEYSCAFPTKEDLLPRHFDE